MGHGSVGTVAIPDRVANGVLGRLGSLPAGIDSGTGATLREGGMGVHMTTLWNADPGSPNRGIAPVHPHRQAGPTPGRPSAARRLRPLFRPEPAPSRCVERRRSSAPRRCGCAGWKLLGGGDTRAHLGERCLCAVGKRLKNREHERLKVRDGHLSSLLYAAVCRGFTRSAI